MDQSKKTMRHFYCRDVLWETFEQMANDFDCSIDYLINESMRYYARSKNYQAGPASQDNLKPPSSANGPQVMPPAPPRSRAPTPPPPSNFGGALPSTGPLAAMECSTSRISGRRTGSITRGCASTTSASTRATCSTSATTSSASPIDKSS